MARYGIQAVTWTASFGDLLMANGSLEKASLIGGALAAIVASVCCLGPLVLVTVGISGAWISNLVAFEPGTFCAVPQTRRIYKALFWVVSAMVLVALGFPYTARFFY